MDRIPARSIGVTVLAGIGLATLLGCAGAGPDADEAPRAVRVEPTAGATVAPGEPGPTTRPPRPIKSH